MLSCELFPEISRSIQLSTKYFKQLFTSSPYVDFHLVQIMMMMMMMMMMKSFSFVIKIKAFFKTFLWVIMKCDLPPFKQVLTSLL
ncbi:hypothetical protein HanPI659440_Chr09g0352731 [Helianthus annuus]|nr:hypothetical protein HanPI659440_Chr09g0352731 [Helianthus annuus]